MSIIRVENVGYTYQSKYQKVEALKEVNCEFEAGNSYISPGFRRRISSITSIR